MKNVRRRGGHPAVVGLVAAGLLAFMVAPAKGDGVTWNIPVQWTGEAGDGLWSNPLNWEGGAIPNTTNQYAVFSDTATNGAHTIIVDGDYTVNRVEVSGGDNRRFEFVQHDDNGILTGKLTVEVTTQVAAPKRAAT